MSPCDGALAKSNRHSISDWTEQGFFLQNPSFFKAFEGFWMLFSPQKRWFLFWYTFFKKLVFAISYSTKIMAKLPLLLPQSPWLKTRKFGLSWRIITSWSYILIDDSKSGRFHYLIRAIFPYVGKCPSGRRYRPWLLSCLSPVCLYLPPCVTRLVFQSHDR